MQQKQIGNEYTVYPLEGVWTTSDGSRDGGLNKDALVYQIMIRQPDVVTASDFARAKESVLQKKQHPYFENVRFVTYTEGRAVQAIYVGPFDTEGATFAQMTEYLTQHNLQKRTIMGGYQHREIYISDFRRTNPTKLRTLLRYAVEPQR